MSDWKKIGDICEIIRGNGVQKTDFVESGVGCIHYGQIYTHYGPFTYSTNKFVSKEVFEKARKASKGDIIMTDTSENVEDICKSVAYLGEEDIAVSNHALILKHKQDPKFLTYSTLTYSFLNQKRKYVVGAKVSGIKPENLAQIKIYLPSLSEQQRIVEQLDTFTSSIENLKEQIAQRRKQYEYYRDQLLDLASKRFPMVTLKDVAIIKNGKDYKNLSEGNIPVYGTGGIMTYVDCFFSNKPSVLLPRKGSVENIYYVEEAFWTVDTLYWTDIDDNKIMPKFLFLSLKRYNLKDYAYGGARPSLSQPILYGLEIPLPPLDEQQRIVSILDTFEASIQNLEAQLKEREKQYEYYRNKLLTFE